MLYDEMISPAASSLRASILPMRMPTIGMKQERTETAWKHGHAGFQSGVSHERLQPERKQDGAAIKHEAQHGHKKDTGGIGAIFEDVADPPQDGRVMSSRTTKNTNPMTQRIAQRENDSASRTSLLPGLYPARSGARRCRARGSRCPSSQCRLLRA